jgi:hypothetical protein
MRRFYIMRCNNTPPRGLTTPVRSRHLDPSVLFGTFGGLAYRKWFLITHPRGLTYRSPKEACSLTPTLNIAI